MRGDKTRSYTNGRALRVAILGEVWSADEPVLLIRTYLSSNTTARKGGCLHLREFQIPIRSNRFRLGEFFMYGAEVAGEGDHEGVVGREVGRRNQ